MSWYNVVDMCKFALMPKGSNKICLPSPEVLMTCSTVMEVVVGSKDTVQGTTNKHRPCLSTTSRGDASTAIASKYVMLLKLDWSCS